VAVGAGNRSFVMPKTRGKATTLARSRRQALNRNTVRLENGHLGLLEKGRRNLI
jgi:hypothetical protein